MNSVKKSLLASGAVVLSCTALFLGIRVRDRADEHVALNPFESTHTLLVDANNSDAPSATAADYYEFVDELIKREYVDPVSDERKLSTGAIRGMVLYLDNPDCRFMDPEEYKAFSESQAGKFQGTGVQLGYELPSKKELAAALPTSMQTLAGDRVADPSTAALMPENGLETTHLPAVVVESVAPGSPAEKAGVKVGDTLNSVDGQWVMNPYDVNSYNLVYDAYKTKKTSVEAYIEARRDLRKKLKASITPSKAIDRLTLGSAGMVKAVWSRGNALVTTNIGKGVTTEEAVSKEPDGALAVHFLPGLSDRLRAEIGTGPVTLDLRNNQFGDPDELRLNLELFGPAGTYGKFANYKGKQAKMLTTSTGSKPRPLTLIVDRSTSGIAEMFALALSSKGYAKIEGGDMSPDKNLIELVKLSDGGGYTLVTGNYVTGAEQARKGS